MSLSDDFNDLAAQFRRIHDVDPAAAQRQIRAASAWGAKLYKRGVGAGVLDSPPGLKWPEPPESIEIDEPSGWQTAWTWLTIVYEYCLPTEVPPNLVASRYERRQSPDGAAVVVGEFDPSDWRIRAEKYAAFAKLLADGTASQPEPPATPTEERNCFCYEEWQRGQSYKEINAALRKHPEWDCYEDHRHVRSAISSWADLRGLMIRKGRPGRPKKDEKKVRK